MHHAGGWLQGKLPFDGTSGVTTNMFNDRAQRFVSYGKLSTGAFFSGCACSSAVLLLFLRMYVIPSSFGLSYEVVILLAGSVTEVAYDR